ncbi:MAG: F0F1 ATP synthase subunit B [Bacteroidaceae bacterium]|nr:F0F1 ATP synthase subunit B [Bacteroidaceae bacterium]MBQ8807621.1 F0F1 ATP synthase subunit B [Bacteroidaceae bacterium]
MGLLQPETGLLFWMCLAFGIVLIVLCKWGFPVIIRSIEERKEYIDSSLDAARIAEEKLQNIEQTSRQMIESAETKRGAILRNAAEERDRIIAEARSRAESESVRIITEAKRRAETERETILANARAEVATIAVAVSERLLRSKLNDTDSQTVLAGQLLDEINNSKAEA